MDSSYLFYIFTGRVPLFLLLFAGIVFALVRWNRHPRVSFLVILGLVFYLLESTFFTFIVFLLPNIIPTGLAIVASNAFYTVLFILDDVAYAAVIILLVSAVFTQRNPDSKASL
ncbi:MAG TPA: hypothetical protein VIT88_05650 [Pyrinomonadaceae bacterium]